MVAIGRELAACVGRIFPQIFPFSSRTDKHLKFFFSSSKHVPHDNEHYEFAKSACFASMDLLCVAVCIADVSSHGCMQTYRLSRSSEGGG